MVTVAFAQNWKQAVKSVVFTNKVGKQSRYFLGVFNKTIIPLAPVGYQMIIANLALRAPGWVFLGILGGSVPPGFFKS